MTRAELNCQNAVDNAYNHFSSSRQIFDLDAQDLRDTKKYVSSTYFWNYVVEVGGLPFREAVTKVLS